MSNFSPEMIKQRIKAGIRELDRSDYDDICKMIKIFIPTIDNTRISVSERGTYIHLDQLDDALLQQLDNIILTKLQRIHMNQ